MKNNTKLLLKPSVSILAFGADADRGGRGESSKENAFY
jgi:hypothetical protein